MKTSDVLNECKKILTRHYGRRFKGLVLHGSTARGKAESGSDIDLLVLLDGPIDYLYELRQIVDVLYPVQLESDRLISAKPVADSDYQAGTLQLYRKARREGSLV